LGNIAQPPDKACYPLDRNESQNYIPCGAIANSLFSGIFLIMDGGNFSLTVAIGYLFL
jgi:hypothetical protein